MNGIEPNMTGSNDSLKLTTPKRNLKKFKSVVNNKRPYKRDMIRIDKFKTHSNYINSKHIRSGTYHQNADHKRSVHDDSSKMLDWVGSLITRGRTILLTLKENEAERENSLDISNSEQMHLESILSEIPDSNDIEHNLENSIVSLEKHDQSADNIYFTNNEDKEYEKNDNNDYNDDINEESSEDGVEIRIDDYETEDGVVILPSEEENESQEEDMYESDEVNFIEQYNEVLSDDSVSEEESENIELNPTYLPDKCTMDHKYMQAPSFNLHKSDDHEYSDDDCAAAAADNDAVDEGGINMEIEYEEFDANVDDQNVFEEDKETDIFYDKNNVDIDEIKAEDKKMEEDDYSDLSLNSRRNEIKFSIEAPHSIPHVSWAQDVLSHSESDGQSLSDDDVQEDLENHNFDTTDNSSHNNINMEAGTSDHNQDNSFSSNQLVEEENDEFDYQLPSNMFDIRSIANQVVSQMADDESAIVYEENIISTAAESDIASIGEPNSNEGNISVDILENQLESGIDDLDKMDDTIYETAESIHISMNSEIETESSTIPEGQHIEAISKIPSLQTIPKDLPDGSFELMTEINDSMYSNGEDRPFFSVDGNISQEYAEKSSSHTDSEENAMYKITFTGSVYHNSSSGDNREDVEPSDKYVSPFSINPFSFDMNQDKKSDILMATLASIDEQLEASKRNTLQGDISNNDVTKINQIVELESEAEQNLNSESTTIGFICKEVAIDNRPKDGGEKRFDNKHTLSIQHIKKNDTQNDRPKDSSDEIVYQTVPNLTYKSVDNINIVSDFENIEERSEEDSNSVKHLNTKRNKSAGNINSTFNDDIETQDDICLIRNRLSHVDDSIIYHTAFNDRSISDNDLEVQVGDSSYAGRNLDSELPEEHKKEISVPDDVGSDIGNNLPESYVMYFDDINDEITNVASKTVPEKGISFLSSKEVSASFVVDGKGTSTLSADLSHISSLTKEDIIDDLKWISVENKQEEGQNNFIDDDSIYESNSYQQESYPEIKIISPKENHLEQDGPIGTEKYSNNNPKLIKLVNNNVSSPSLTRRIFTSPYRVVKSVATQVRGVVGMLPMLRYANADVFVNAVQSTEGSSNHNTSEPDNTPLLDKLPDNSNHTISDSLITGISKKILSQNKTDKPIKLNLEGEYKHMPTSHLSNEERYKILQDMETLNDLKYKILGEDIADSIDASSFRNFGDQTETKLTEIDQEIFLTLELDNVVEIERPNNANLDLSSDISLSDEIKYDLKESDDCLNREMPSESSLLAEKDQTMQDLKTSQVEKSNSVISQELNSIFQKCNSKNINPLYELSEDYKNQMLDSVKEEERPISSEHAVTPQHENRITKDTVGTPNSKKKRRSMRVRKHRITDTPPPFKPAKKSRKNNKKKKNSNAKSNSKDYKNEKKDKK